MTSVSGRLGAPCLILDLGLEGPRREQGDFSYNGRHQPQTCFLSIGGGLLCTLFIFPHRV